MQDSNEAWHLFVYDLRKGLWMHEDNTHVTSFCKVDDELYALVGASIIALNGTTGTLEDDFEWAAETGIMHYTYSSSKYSYADPEHKYVSRYDIRAKMPIGSEMRVYVEYDSTGNWEYAGTVKIAGVDTVVLPVRPHRCDHLRLRFVGKGDARILSLCRNLVHGSDCL